MSGATNIVALAVTAVLTAATACSRGAEAPAGPEQAQTPVPDAPEAAAAEPASIEAESEAEPAAPEPPAQPPRAEQLELAFVGDVIFGRYRPDGYDPIPEDGHPVFEAMASALKADVLVGNLETPLVRELPTDSPIGSRFAFGASLEHAKLLTQAGFSAMSLANNHWFDMRLEGVQQTPLLLQELGIVPLGAAVAEGSAFRVETVEKNGWSIGFVAITTRTNAPLREGVPTLPYLRTREIEPTITPLLREARAEHDLLVVVVHWGDEYDDGPSLPQVRAAHALVDAGADLVIGHHPHVLQGVQRHGRGLIAYSLGNFLFENTNDPPRLTGVLRVRYQSEPADPPCLDGSAAVLIAHQDISPGASRRAPARASPCTAPRVKR